jgi:hypothetical protein
LLCCFYNAACYFFLFSSSFSGIFFGSNNSGVSIYKHSLRFLICSRSSLKVSFCCCWSSISCCRSFEFCFNSFMSFTRWIICCSSYCISCAPRSSSLGSLSELSPDSLPSVSDLYDLSPVNTYFLS